MHHKQRQHFTITLMVSFFVHLFALTLLFTVPDVKNQDEYKKVRVRLGIKNTPKSDNVAMAEKYASFSPSAGYTKQSSAQDSSPANNTNPIIKNNIESTILKSPQETTKQDEKTEPTAPPEVNNNIENTPATSEVTPIDSRVKNVATAKKASTPQAINKPKDTYEDYGTVIGNSHEDNSDTLESYEQMLPLWLDKFKQYPTNPKGWRIEGEGEVFIKIDRKGKVLLSKVIKSTGSDALDKALTKMIADADPVLPVPDDYHTDKKTFSYKIAFEFKEPKNEQ